MLPSLPGGKVDKDQVDVGALQGQLDIGADLEPGVLETDNQDLHFFRMPLNRRHFS